MEDDDYNWSKILKNSYYGTLQKEFDWTYAKKTIYKDYYKDLDSYSKMNYDLIKQLEQAKRKVDLEKARLNALPHYIQVYGEDLPGDVVSTKWIRYTNKRGIDNHARAEIRTVVYQDGESFYYTDYYKGESIRKPVKLTEAQTEAFMLIVLKAEYGD